MANPDLASILNNPGRLCHTPTNLATAFPHGGTAIGAVREVVCTSVQGRKEIRDEAFGQEIHEILWTGENWAVACILRQWDADAIALLFPNSAVGTTTQQRIVSGPGTNRPGYLLSNMAKKILFSPLDPDRVPAVLFYKAIPLPRETLDLNLALDKRFEVGAVFVALRDSSDRVYQAGFLKDMTVS